MNSLSHQESRRKSRQLGCRVTKERGKKKLQAEWGREIVANELNNLCQHVSIWYQLAGPTMHKIYIPFQTKMAQKPYPLQQHILI